MHHAAKARNAILDNPRAFALKYFDMDLWECEDEWVNLALEYNDEKIFIDAPVDHGKSTGLSQIKPIMDICKDRDERVLWGTVSPTLKKGKAKWVRDQLEKNTELIADYGEFYHPDNTWESTKFTVIRNNHRLTDPTFTACTTNEGIEGVKATKGYLDDFIDSSSATSEVMRGSVAYWLDNVYLNRLAPDAPLTVIGRRWHPEDIYSTFARRGFKIFKYIAVDDAWTPGSVLCPERWSIEKLKKRHEEIGTVAFNQNFRGDPSAVIGQRLDPLWLRYFDEELKYQNKVLTVDPSAGRKTSDFFVVATMGLTIHGSKKYIDVPEILRGRGKGYSFPEQPGIVAGQWHKHHPDLCIIECNSDNGALYELIKQDHPYIKVKALWEKRNKLVKIDASSSYYENGTLRFRRLAPWLSAFEHEYSCHPGAFDDQLDCICMGLDYLGPMIKSKRVTPWFPS